MEVSGFSFFEMSAPRLSPVAKNFTQISTTGSASDGDDAPLFSNAKWTFDSLFTGKLAVL